MEIRKVAKISWLNLVPTFTKLLKVNKSEATVVCQGTLDDFPVAEPNYQLVVISLDKDFMQWQRWYVQCFAHQLSNQGYMFIKAEHFIDGNKGLKAYVFSALRWLRWSLACRIAHKGIRNALVSKKLITLNETYGLNLVSFPHELKFLKGKGLLFQKNSTAEVKIQQKLTQSSHVIHKVEHDYKDRIIEKSVIELDTVKPITAIELIPKTNENVLVLAPHPDDELVGCGGTLLALSNLGAKIHVVQMSQGVTCDALKNEDKEVKLIRRWHEAKRVAQRFDFQQYYWPSNAKGDLDNSKVNENNLLNLIQELKPAILFVPSDNDLHKEHQQVFNMLTNVLKYDHQSVTVLKYPVWGALKKIDYAIDITAHRFDVLHAMYDYKVAMKAEDYASRMHYIWAYQGQITMGDSEKMVEVFSISR